MKKTLLYHCRALLMDEADTLLEGAYVAVEGDKIASVGTQRPQGDFDREIDCKNNVLMPGLVNAHTHVPMTLLRGYGGGCDLQTWLNQWIFPAEAKLDDRAVAAGAALGLAEMIASGTTCIADMYMHTPAIAKQVLAAGISANLSCGGVYFGTPGDFSPDTCGDCRNQIELTEEFHGAGGGQILVDASIHGEYTSNIPPVALDGRIRPEKGPGDARPPLRDPDRARGVQEALGGQDSLPDLRPLRRMGHPCHRRPLRLDHRGGLGHHGPEKGVSCVHNPVSNLKLGSGVAWIPAMKEAGVNIALGTDGVSSNNNTDLFEEMKFAAILHNGVTRNPWPCCPRTPWPWLPGTGPRPWAAAQARSPPATWPT